MHSSKRTLTALRCIECWTLPPLNCDCEPKLSDWLLDAPEGWFLDGPDGGEPENRPPERIRWTSKASQITPDRSKLTVRMNTHWFRRGDLSEWLKPPMASPSGPTLTCAVPSQFQVYTRDAAPCRALLKTKRTGSLALLAKVAIPQLEALSRPMTSRMSPLLTSSSRLSLTNSYQSSAFSAR